jgi:hypothetical protein
MSGARRPTKTRRFTNTDGQDFSVHGEEQYILWVHGDTRMVVDKFPSGYHTVDFSSREARDQAVRDIAGDHPVYDRDDSDVQINPAAPSYKRSR